MQIIVPMSGFGERFRRVGYKLPKPLIEVEGKPIIAHIIDMFPGEHDFIFICNKDHLAHSEYKMRETLLHYCPTGKVVPVESRKLGPVDAVLQAQQYIKLNAPCIVNYCDFTCYWNWQHFKQFVATLKCDGVIPAYKGFHPHSLGTTNYAYMREENGFVLDIQEKMPYTDNRMNEYASSGTYYFADSTQMIDAFKQTMEQNLNVNGEFYVSLVYKILLKLNKEIAVYELQHFMQWGTPDDVVEYNMWSQTFKNILNLNKHHASPKVGSVVIPMAGLGKRFVDEGYTVTKPLIKVSGTPMVIQATKLLPLVNQYEFVVRQDMPSYQKIIGLLKQYFIPSGFVELTNVTDGQATSAKLGVEKLLDNISAITIGTCDSGAIYDKDKFNALVNDDIDLIVWGVRGYANAIRNPQMYGWVEADGKHYVQRAGVKQILNNVTTDFVILGTFTFKNIKIFMQCYESLIAREGRINGEYYLDSCITDALNLGFKCKIFEVDSYIPWGTPNELRTFEYWQSCFHKWGIHPYKLELDPMVDKESLVELTNKYREILPELPRVQSC